MSRPAPTTAPFVRPLWLAVALCAVAAGCDSSPFSIAPPPPPELAAIRDPKALNRTITVELIGASGDADDRAYWQQAARQEASRSKVIFTAVYPPEAAPADALAKLVREAAGRGTSALIVETDGSPALDSALVEARDRGVKVVLIGAKAAKGGPFPVVRYAPFDEPARQLAGAAVQRSRADGLPADGSAVVLVNERVLPEPLAALRVEGLEKALKEAGVKRVERLTFRGKGAEADRVLRARLAADPGLAVVLTHEEHGLLGAVGAHQALKGKRTFGLGGVATVERIMSPAAAMACAGVVDNNPVGQAREAVAVAARLGRGEAAPEETLVPTPYRPFSASNSDAEASDKASIIPVPDDPKSVQFRERAATTTKPANP